MKKAVYVITMCMFSFAVALVCAAAILSPALTGI